MLIAAWAMACRPLEQKRLMVSAGTLFGHFAKNTAFLATFSPCSASGMAQPSSTSSTSSALRPGTRSRAPFIATAAKSSGRATHGRTNRRSNDHIEGECHVVLLVAQLLVVHEHELHALLTLLLAAQ